MLGATPRHVRPHDRPRDPRRERNGSGADHPHGGRSDSSKAPVARLADQVSAVFVPFVIGVALLSLAIWLLIGATFEVALTTPSRSSSFRVRAPWGSPPPRP